MSPKSIGIVVVVALVAAIAWPQVRKARERSTVASADYLKSVTYSYQQRVPYEPSAEMVVYKVEMVEKVLTFGVRLEDREEGNVREADRAEIKRGVTRVLCADTLAAKLRNGGMTLRANVVDRTGTPITFVAVLPNGC